jgi:glutamine---fructose-6-phosphate transaminase (isomerizing)
MCGIVGVTGNKDAVNILVHGLQKLEYRGYDSAGLYVNDEGKKDYIVKRTGAIGNLRDAVNNMSISGNAGIAHTRWATHGGVTIENAHPHFSQDNRFYLVHNGVIENYRELKEEYLSDVKFTSQTDTEVVVQLVDYFAVKEHLTAKEAFKKALSKLKGSSYAFQLMDRQEPDTIYVAKNKSPLLIGLGQGYNVVCSDSLAMLNETHDFLELNDGDFVTVKPDSVTIEDKDGNVITDREPFHADIDASDTDKGTYPYYMLKEIDEQPNVMRKLSAEYLEDDGNPMIDKGLLDDIRQSDRLYIIAAGTSYHAGLVGKRLFEKLSNIPTEVHVASEFAYNTPLLSKKPFFILLSQSGETADSREVLVHVNKQGYKSLTVTNVANSTLSREANYTLLLHAGPEISVASTKAYTAQITVEAILAKAIGMADDLKEATDFNLKQQLGIIATSMQSIVDEKEQINEISQKYFVNANRAFYIGRGIDYFVSLEASLKLKEISYILAEGFASGELKHGTIALIEQDTPVVGIITQHSTAGLTRSNLEETMARGAKTITIAMHSMATDDDDIVIPDVNEMLAPLLSVIPAQLLAYYTSLNKGLDVDHPRNLAKSVTVQ